uniref:Uncharacterized protein n=1 Tax=Acrobeloides nanus TaxID=290746 RepID=A0A914DHY4_9BILA
MHLVATNLWTWVRVIFFEESVMYSHLINAFSNGSTSHENKNTSTSESITIDGTLLGYVYTGLVEYSVIGATVMFIVWNNMKYINHHKICRDYKEHRKINFNNISYGILLGLVFLASTIVVLVMYKDLEGKHEELAAAITFCATNLAQVNFLRRVYIT